MIERASNFVFLKKLELPGLGQSQGKTLTFLMTLISRWMI
jgi:hypothetical protein